MVNMFKAINSKVERVIVLARQVPLKIGEWTCVVNFTVVPLDDFDVVLG